MGYAASTLITLNCGYFLPLSLAYGMSKAVAEGLPFLSTTSSFRSLSHIFFNEKAKHFCFFWLGCQNTCLRVAKENPRRQVWLNAV